MPDSTIRDGETLDQLEVGDDSSDENLKAPTKKVNKKTKSSGSVKSLFTKLLFFSFLAALVAYTYLVVKVMTITSGDPKVIIRESFKVRSGANAIIVGDLLLTPELHIENRGVIRQRSGENDYQNALEFLSTMAENNPPDIFRTLINPSADETILENTSVGALPIVSEYGRSSLITYSRPFTENEDTVEISIVIKGLGISQTLAEAAIKLKPEVSLSFSPYAEHLDDLVIAARKAGHEVLIELPMEPTDYPYIDPGPYAMRHNLSITENIALLDWVLSRTQGYVGLINYQGDALLNDPTFVSTVIPIILRRGLMYLQGDPLEENYLQKTVEEQGHYYTGIDINIDIDDDEFSFEEKLNEALWIAENKGRVTIGIKPFPLLLMKLALWLKELPEDEYSLTPISSRAQIHEAKRLGFVE